MAKTVITSGYVAIGGTDYSAQISEFTLEFQVEEKDITTFADVGFKNYIGGLKGGTATLKFTRDAAFSGLDAYMETNLGAVVTWEVRFSSASVGADNPKWTGNFLITSWKPFAGAVGSVLENSETYTICGAWTRATS